MDRNTGNTARAPGAKMRPLERGQILTKGQSFMTNPAGFGVKGKWARGILKKKKNKYETSYCSSYSPKFWFRL